ncbi:MAG: DNA repair protein RecO [Sedimentisphaerales bacterium]|nr:DNA repair protein RecO [Sedimentisphaerales bacterium]
MLTKDLAICIRAVDYSETSQIVTFFTRRTGKIGAIAKGSKRPKSAFDGPIEILSHGKIVFADSGKDKLATLTEFEPAYDAPRNDFFALNCCFFAAELLNHLTHEYDPHPELYDSFLNFLQNVEQHETQHNMLAALILFQLGLLKEIGLQPILSYCPNCKTQYAQRKTPYETYFSSSANGLVCRDCEPSFPDKIRLSKNATTCLTSLKQISNATQGTLREIEKILVHHFTELLGRPPKMAKHILNESAGYL